MNSRTAILAKLRAAQSPFPTVAAPTDHISVTPIEGLPQEALKARFVREATLLAAVVHQPESNEAAIATVLELIGDDSSVLAWDDLPLTGLEEALSDANITRAHPRDGSVRVGITGAAAALAATGSLVVSSGAGQPRSASLLPATHIALITDAHLLPNFEAWVALQRADGTAAFRAIANTVLISGPSRTADIAMELILGMHGPRSLHIIFCPA